MELPPEALKAVPGALGSLSAVLLMRENWRKGLAMVLPAIALSWYAAPWLSEKAGMPEGLTGYLLGMFGMAAAAKTLDTMQNLDAGSLIGSIARKWFGLTERP